MKFSLLLIFSMALLESVAMPVQATISEDSLMVSQNNAYENQKFRLKVIEILLSFKMGYFLEHECESLNSYLYFFISSLSSKVQRFKKIA